MLSAFHNEAVQDYRSMAERVKWLSFMAALMSATP